jgi:PAS domain S-box-containing protein
MEITKFKSQLFAALGQMTVYLQRAQNAFTRLARRAADKPRRLREAFRSREHDLRRLLASSPDAIVVTNVDRRFIAANPKALDLFGVSEANMRKFTIDAFLSHCQILCFAAHESHFMRREKFHGECTIRRLDGSLRVAECILVANFAPYRHLYRFRNAKNYVKPIATFKYPPATLWALANRFDRCPSLLPGPANFISLLFSTTALRIEH